MQVFTDEWVAQLKERYGTRPAYQKPRNYFLAVEDYNQGIRLRIEEWVAALPAPVHHNLIQRLRSPKNFIHTYHELVVGDLLRRKGFDLEYEKEKDGLTPDWFVRAKGGIPAFVLEVFTSDLSLNRSSEQKQIRQLRSRLEEIPVGVALHVRSERLNVSVDDRRCKDISDRVRRWLMENEPSEGAQLELDEFTFHVARVNKQYPNVQPIGPSTAFAVNRESLRKNLHAKIKKYRKVVKDRALPLVIGVIADFGTGLTLDDLETELQGRIVDNIITDSTGMVVGREINKMDDGLFTMEPFLSAVVWVERVASEAWVMKAIHNTSAMNALPDGALTER